LVEEYIDLMKSIVAITVLIILILVGILINLKSLAPTLGPVVEEVVDEVGQSLENASTTETMIGETSTTSATSTPSE